VDCIHTAEDIVQLLCQPGSPIILVFFYPSANTQFQVEPLHRGRKIQVGGKILRFSTEIAGYLGNGTRYAHSCYGTLTESHTRSVE